MSSFKKRVGSKQQTLPPGTCYSPGSSSTIITSTGIPSLDDILGGGLPLSCSLLLLAPDLHSAYGELVQKYFIAQGIACGQSVCILDDDAEAIVGGCMWMPGTSTPIPSSSRAEDEEDEKASDHDAKIKIAWRYEQMKQFETTVATPNQSGEDYCRVFDLTCRIPENIIKSVRDTEQLVLLPVSAPSLDDATAEILDRIAQTLSLHHSKYSGSQSLRLCIPALGSPQWGDLSPQRICYFLHSLRALLRLYPSACASISLPADMCTDSWGGVGWIQKLSWLSDASITLSAFTANPSLSSMFSAHHGLVHIHSLPAPHTLLPASDKHSTLRGLSSSGENNLAFKCMRKRLIFETLHLDLEGGVSERRTTPAANSIAVEASHIHNAHAHDPAMVDNSAKGSRSGGLATVAVEIEPQGSTVDLKRDEMKEGISGKKVKAKKKVAFTSELDFCPMKSHLT